MARAFVFPGQGSQSVGMGSALAASFPAARETFEEVDEALKQNLSRLMANGPEDELMLTENAQPALMAVSVAVIRVITGEGGHDVSSLARFVAGHSLGEYSALAAAGALSVPVAARLLKRRGQAMQQAVPVGEGAMVALLGADLEPARAIAAAATESAAGQICVPANDNAPGQVVLSGHRVAIERAAEIARERGVKKAVLLPVSAPFHCPLMAPAADIMAEALEEVAIAPPSVPVVANVSAAPVTDPAEIRDLLVQQVTAMVRWRESVLAMKAHDVDTLVELGAGKVLATMTRRIDRELTGISVGTPEDIDQFLGSV